MWLKLLNEPLSDLTCVIWSWGSWFDKYGDDFIKNVSAADPQPAEFLFITDKNQEGLPLNFKQVIIPDIDYYNRWQYSLEHIKTNWWCALGLDDLIPSDAFKDLIFEGDIVMSAWVDSNNFIHTPTKERYEQIFENTSFQMQGWWMAKVELDKRIPKRLVVFEDWIQWYEFRMHNVDVRFDTKIRMTYVLHKSQHSNINSDASAIARVDLMRTLCQQQNVIPGTCWPPECYTQTNT